MSPRGRVILGISDDYVANVALFSDGKPLFAAANERFTRKKGDAGFPGDALDAALNATGLEFGDIDDVVVANRTHFVYRLLRAQFKDYEHDFFSLKQKGYLRYHDLVRASRSFRGGVAAFNALLVLRKLGRGRASEASHRRALGLQPADVETHELLAQALILKGSYRAAEGVLAQALHGIRILLIDLEIQDLFEYHQKQPNHA